MAKKDEYSFLAIKVLSYKAYVDASINYEVRDKCHYSNDAKIYKFSSHLEIEGICTWPEEREGDEYAITIYGHEIRQGDFELTLSDCNVMDEHWSPKYKRVRGKDVPVYDVPKGMGTLNKVRGAALWTGCIWVPTSTITNMLNLLTAVTLLYIAIHENKIERHRWIVGLTLQTTDPADE